MHVEVWQIILLGLLQGVTELFPISSLGHTVILPPLLGMGNVEMDENFLSLITALHLGTCVALLIYFRHEWLRLLQTITGVLREGELHRDSEGWISWLIIIGCIPAGLLGLLFERDLKTLFASPIPVAIFLLLNGFVLLGGEQLRRRTERNMALLSPEERESHFRPLKALSWKEALIVGLAQAMALLPGFSRSGMTLVASLGLNMTHEDAARYSFLLSTPLILGASLVELPALLNVDPSTLGLIFLGMVIAGVAAYFSTGWLMRYFRTGRLDPFAYYCFGAGTVALALFLALHIGF
ncbi:MAG: undecaprenyl-diphosphate phosphatase [Ktedonobacteraceae bacterium]